MIGIYKADDTHAYKKHISALEIGSATYTGMVCKYSKLKVGQWIARWDAIIECHYQLSCPIQSIIR